MLSDRAVYDIDQALIWYGSIDYEFDLKFLQDVDTLMRLLSNYPELHPTIYDEIRRVNLRNFPYCVLYQIIENKIVILSAPHSRSDYMSNL